MAELHHGRCMRSTWERLRPHSTSMDRRLGLRREPHVPRTAPSECKPRAKIRLRCCESRGRHAAHHCRGRLAKTPRTPCGGVFLASAQTMSQSAVPGASTPRVQRRSNGESSTTPLAPGRVDFRPRPGPCERRSKSAARGGVGRPVEKCSAQLCSGVGQENCGGAAISPYRERGTRSVCSDGDVD